VSSLTTAITGHPCAWQSTDGMRWVVYEKAGGLWLVSWDGINASVHTRIVEAGMGPAVVRMAPSNDVALFWATREGDLLCDRLARTGTGYQMEGTPMTLVDVSEGDDPPVGYASAAIQDLTGRLCVFYDCWGAYDERGMYKCWLTADMVLLDKRQVWFNTMLLGWAWNQAYNMRAVAQGPSADFLLAYMRPSINAPDSIWHRDAGLYSCRFTNINIVPYYTDEELEWYVVPTIEYLVTTDADDLYGIDAQASGVYVIHYIHDGEHLTKTSNDGGQTWE
jgi:hypothetical protein